MHHTGAAGLKWPVEGTVEAPAESQYSVRVWSRLPDARYALNLKLL